MTKPCVPEWCGSGAEPHDDECDNALMLPMTKREFVDYQVAAAEHALEAFRVLMETMRDGFTGGKELAMAVEEVEESAVCFAGIGSCGRGWCRHS